MAGVLFPVWAQPMKRRNATAKLMWGFRHPRPPWGDRTLSAFVELKEYDEVDLDDPQAVKDFCEEWDADLYWVIYRKQRRKK